MLNLIKSDFRRVLKDKLIIVLCIIGAAFALITPLMYKGILSMAEGDMIGSPMMDMFSAKTNFFNAFSLGNNFGLIVPVLIAIIICKDFSFGTVRNKIIGGHKRSEIFFSMFVTTFVSVFGIILLHALLTLCVSLVFFDYQSKPFEFNDVVYFIISLLLEVCVYLFVAALLSWMCASFKNVGIVIVMYVALSFVMTLVSSIIMVAIQILSMDVGNETVVEVLEFIQRINIFNSYSYIGVGTEYKLEDVLYIVAPALVFTAGLIGLGTLKFNKKDLK